MAGEVLTMIEGDLGATIESDFASPVTLIDPDGKTVSTSVHGGPLYARVTDDYQMANEAGGAVVVKDPMIIMRLSSLARVPVGGEKWAIIFRPSPSIPVGKTYLLDAATKAPERADSIGFIRLFPKQAVQS